jgi:hypothetical protein
MARSIIPTFPITRYLVIIDETWERIHTNNLTRCLELAKIENLSIYVNTGHGELVPYAWSVDGRVTLSEKRQQSFVPGAYALNYKTAANMYFRPNIRVKRK